MQAFLDIFDIYLLEAVINGILLGGVLALLALGLNLIFGVIDVTWICYAELVMIGMYGMYYLIQVYHLPYWAAAPLVILLVALLGAALHYLVIAPLVVQQVFDLVKRIRGSGLTVLIVEQNVQQVLKVVDRAYLLEAGTIRASGTSTEMLATDTVKQAYLGV